MVLIRKDLTVLPMPRHNALKQDRYVCVCAIVRLKQVRLPLSHVIRTPMIRISSSVPSTGYQALSGSKTCHILLEGI